MVQCSLETCEPSSVNVKVERNISNCARKADLKETAGNGTPMLASKSLLVSMKNELDNLVINKLKTVHGDI